MYTCFIRYTRIKLMQCFSANFIYQRYAQVDFLLMILGGLFFVALAALFYSLEPSKVVCICRQWFVAVGYSLELVPLAVKVAM